MENKNNFLLSETLGAIGANAIRGNTKRIAPSLRWCFTYNNYTSDNLKSLLETLGAIGAVKYVFQEEIGESGTEHLQGYIHFPRRVRPKSIFPDHPTMHWEKCRNWKCSVAYCSDHNKRKKDGRIWVQGIILPAPVKTISSDQFYQWQQDIFNKCSQETEDRKIYWVWEGTGNTGKTSFAKYLCVRCQAIVLSGKGQDMKYGIIKFMEKYGGPPPIVIIDIPRSVKDFVSYSGIEEIKNGLFFCGKYESDMCVFNPPHVLCLSNSPPDRNKFSEDRWCIYQIINNKLFSKP